MGTPYSNIVSQPVPQREKAHPKQVANSAGAFSFKVDDWMRLDRFLILGSEGGSYYASERKLTLDNVGCVARCVQQDGQRVVRRVVEISDAGRAPKNDPALLVLAFAAKRGDLETRQLACQVMPKVARIGTHLFHFAEYVKAFGGRGRAINRAFSRWYLNMDPARLALQAVKYQQRDGWAHRDLLRKSRPKVENPLTQQIVHYIVKGWENVGEEPHPEQALQIIWAFERAKGLKEKKDVKFLCKLITDYNLPHECVPNDMKQFPEVWEAMLPHMGLEAMMRNLAKMTSIELLKGLSSATRLVRDKFGDIEALKASRLHPLKLLVALKTYAQGKGEKGKLEWKPVQAIVDALDSAFYASFQAVEPTGKSHLLGIDISGSMSGARISGMPLDARTASAAMAMVVANVEPEHGLFGFCTSFEELEISPRMRLDDVVKYMDGLHMGGTNCALPMIHAMENKLKVDAFHVYTDSETWAGHVHPHVALEQYRQKMGINAKLIVVGMCANEFTIANPDDAGMMDVVGFDTTAPTVMADFVRE